MGKKFNSLNEVQHIQKRWEEQSLPEQARRLQHRWSKFAEEVLELREALKSLDDSFERKLNAGLELADVFIVGFSLADALGFDIERLIWEKISRNYQKYNPTLITELLEQGYSWQETLRIAKELWDEKKEEEWHKKVINGEE